MTNEEAIGHIKDVICENNTIKPNIVVFEQEKEALYMAIKALELTQTGLLKDCESCKTLEQEPCEMTAEKYRQRMIQAFHNADCDELIAICVLPTEKEFEHLEWLLKNHYKKEPCEDAISRQGEKNISKGFEDFMIKSLRKQAESGK